MQITYQLADEDYRDGLRTICATSFSKWTPRIAVAFELLIVPTWLTSRWWDGTGNVFSNLTPLVVFITAFLVLSFLTPRRVLMNVRKQLQQTPAAKAPTTLTVLDSGLHAHSEYTDSTTS